MENIIEQKKYSDVSLYGDESNEIFIYQRNVCIIVEREHIAELIELLKKEIK